MADVRLDAGLRALQLVPLWEVLEEVEIGATMLAQTKGVQLAVTTVDPSVIVEGDRPILAAALANLLQDAFKLTTQGSEAEVRATA